MRTLRLTREDVPDGSVIGVLSDIHIPHHDEHAVKLAIECMEDAGVTHVFLNGDIADCGPISRHPDKQVIAAIEEGDLAESVAPGLWVYEWARTRPCWYIRGNHEGWCDLAIKKNPGFRNITPQAMMGLWEDGDGWAVLPPLSRIRLGAYNWEHGDGFFKTGNGGQNPGSRIKARAPDQHTSIGHLHRKFMLLWSSVDEYGIPRTRVARGNGHLSIPEAHEEYAGTYTDWQQSFEITRVWYDGGRPRFTTDQPEIHRDKRGRPVFEYQGKVYGGFR